nr:NADH dehydrogenase subunit 6 [Sinoscolia sp. 1 GYN-2023a]
MNNILFIFMMSNSIMFYLTKTPLSMGLMLMIQTLTISLNSGMMSFNFWYSYILFLIMLGGMLILFIYISSLSSNMKFLINKNFMNYLLYSSILIILILTMIFKFKFNLMFNSNILSLFNIEIEQNFMLKMSLNKLYNKPTNSMMILMINYLLLTLFIMVKITNIKLGPLRKNF